MCIRDSLYQIIAIHNHTCILTTWQTNETIITNITELVRKVITASEMEEIVERIPYIRTLNITSERYRQELYQKSLDKYDEVEWIKLIKTIYIRHQKKQTQNYELKYFKAAKNIFHEEISLLLNIPLPKIETYIKQKILEN